MEPFTLACPIPIERYPSVMMAHGGGGRLMHELIERMIVPAFGHDLSDQRHDAAVLPFEGTRLAFTTDSYVVSPLFFPGGDIGSMAIHGTVNDLAMAGARPLYISTSFILEEGLSMETLWQVIQSMKIAAERSGVRIVTGDTKVVDRGRCDGLYVNTSGVGVVETALTISPGSVRPGDQILVSGDLGRHGIAVMAVRENLAFESAIESDSAPVSDLVMDLLDAGIEIHCLRDLTRGGLASAMNEIAEAGKVGMVLRETDIPVRSDVQSACEILGFDPLYVANEGRFAAFVPPEHTDRTMEVLCAHPLGVNAAIVGHVTEEHPGRVTMTSRIGAQRIVDMLSGEQLPRIC